MKLSCAGVNQRWQSIRTIKEKSDEDTARCALSCARRIVIDHDRHGYRRVRLVLGGVNCSRGFVGASGTVWAAARTLAIRCDRARAAGCLGLMLMVGSADFPAWAGHSAASDRQ